MTKNKYRPDVSWADVEAMIADNYTRAGREVLFHVKPQANLTTRGYLTVICYPLGTAAGDAEAYATRHPFDPRNVSRLYSQFLRALYDHHVAWEADPWAWDASRRRRARGEA